MPTRTMHMPQRPFSLIDAVNRMAIATGSYANASRAGGADYNGHRVDVDRGYHPGWRAHYFWAGIVWLARGVSFEQALAAAIREHARGALGSEIRVACDTDEQVAACVALGFVTADEAAAAKATWRDARYDLVNEPIDMDRKHGIPGTALLIHSASPEDFRAKVSAYRAEQVERRAQRRVG